MKTNGFFTSSPLSINIINLGEFEDLYYAAFAKLKDLLIGTDLLLANGFRVPHDVHFTYGSEPLASLGGIKLGDFKASLLTQQSILDSDGLRDLLNEGITRKIMHDNELSSQQLNQIQQAHEDSDTRCKGTHLNTEQHIRLRRGIFNQNLRDVSNKSCGMIFGELAEKYRPTVASMASDRAQIHRQSTPEAPQALRELTTPDYVSPYNLNERAKKLNAPGGPEMPCICDPECMCVPLCASDPTQNCLCEENGLFVRVTEGMDIDELDVPDLVRRERRVSKMSDRSVTSSTAAPQGVQVDWSRCVAAWEAAGTVHNHQHNIIQEMEKQAKEQETQLGQGAEFQEPISNSADQFEDVLSTSGISELSEFQHQESPYILPAKMSSLAYREALTQPFSKLCNSSPRRIRRGPSVAQRIFRISGSGSQATKRHLAVDQGTNAGRPKRDTKRTLGDVSFTNLKRALMREPQSSRHSKQDQMEE